MKIEKNKAKPKRPLKGLTDTMKALKIGDSFTIPYGVRAAPHVIAKRIDIKIETLQEGKKLRVWRI